MKPRDWKMNSFHRENYKSPGFFEICDFYDFLKTIHFTPFFKRLVPWNTLPRTCSCDTCTCDRSMCGTSIAAAHAYATCIYALRIATNPTSWAHTEGARAKRAPLCMFSPCEVCRYMCSINVCRVYMCCIYACTAHILVARTCVAWTCSSGVQICQKASDFANMCPILAICVRF